MIISLLLYIPLFLWAHGNIDVGDKAWNFQIHQRLNAEESEGARGHASRMIA
jgi:hypothetical protein